MMSEEVVDDKIWRIKHSDKFISSEIVYPLIKKRYNSKVVYLREYVYINGGVKLTNLWRRYIVKNVDMYSHLIKTCKVIANIKDINNLVSLCCLRF